MSRQFCKTSSENTTGIYNCVLTVPDGFLLCGSSIQMDYSDADFYLKSKKRRRITSEEKDGNLISINSHYYVCPCSGNQIPAYFNYICKGHKQNSVVSILQIENFCDRQFNLFEESKTKKLTINECAVNICRISCPHCSYNGAV